MISSSKGTIHAIAAAGAALLLSAGAPKSSSAAPTIFSCSSTKVKGSASNLEHFVPPGSFRNVVEANVTFAQGGTKASCVIVQFWSRLNANPGADIAVRAMLDAATPGGLPASVVLTRGEEGIARAHTFVFVFTNVAPGVHSVQIQAKASDGQGVVVGQHTTTVNYAP